MGVHHVQHQALPWIKARDPKSIARLSKPLVIFRVHKPFFSVVSSDDYGKARMSNQRVHRRLGFLW